MDNIGFIMIIVVAGIILLSIFFYVVPVALWFQGVLTGARVSLLQLVFMRMRKVPPSVIVTAMINSKKAGLSLSPINLKPIILQADMFRK